MRIKFHTNVKNFILRNEPNGLDKSNSGGKKGEKKEEKIKKNKVLRNKFTKEKLKILKHLQNFKKKKKISCQWMGETRKVSTFK